MSRIAATFTELKAHGRKALIPFVTAGFPFADVTPELMHAMVAGGADVIELGVPFSDPSADGPVIQESRRQSLVFGIRIDSSAGHGARLPLARQPHTGGADGLRQPGRALQPEAWCYCINSRLRTINGATSPFVHDAAAAGVDGVLIVDYPPEECEDFAADLKSQGMDLIFLLAPTSTDERMQQVARIASGYVYYVSLKGVTGSGALDTGAVEAMLPRIRQHVSVPVGVGFGIRDAATAQAIGRVADAVVIGSKIIQLIDNQPRNLVAGTAQTFLREIRTALDS